VHVVEPIERALVDQEVAQFSLRDSRSILREPQQQRRVAGPDLLQEQRVHQAGGVNHERERVALVVRHLPKVEPDGKRRVLGDLGVEYLFGLAPGGRGVRTVAG
jgi:hypothetical protein